MPVVLQVGDLNHLANHAQHMRTVDALCSRAHWQCVRVTFDRVDEPWCGITLRGMHVRRVLSTVAPNDWLLTLDNDIAIVRLAEALHVFKHLMAQSQLHFIAQLNRDALSNATSVNTGMLLVRNTAVGRSVVERMVSEQQREEWCIVSGDQIALQQVILMLHNETRCPVALHAEPREFENRTYWRIPYSHGRNIAARPWLWRDSVAPMPEKYATHHASQLLDRCFGEHVVTSDLASDVAANLTGIQLLGPAHARLNMHDHGDFYRTGDVLYHGHEWPPPSTAKALVSERRAKLIAAAADREVAKAAEREAERARKRARAAAAPPPPDPLRISLGT